MYDRVIDTFAGQIWALEPRTLDIAIAILSERASGRRPSREEIDTRIGAAKLEAAAERRYDPETGEYYAEVIDPVSLRSAGYRAESNGSEMPRRSKGMVAIIPVRGVISQRMQLFEDVSSTGTSVESLTRKFRTAMADETVSAILFDHGSPGGGAFGLKEFAAEIRSARNEKIIESIATSTAQSASYWLYAQASRRSVTPSGFVGSVGVYSVHQAVGRLLNAAGIDTTIVQYGENKTLGNMFQDLSAEAKADIQKHVDLVGEHFVGDLAKAFGVGVDHVRQNFGGGLSFGAKEAVAKGMADEVATIDEVVRRLGGRVQEPRRRSGGGMMASNQLRGYTGV